MTDNEPPLVKGGQGRTRDTLISVAKYLTWLWIGALCWGITYGIYWLLT